MSQTSGFSRIGAIRILVHLLPKTELLNETIFYDFDHARAALARWTANYNQRRPNSALGYLTPAAFAGTFTATSDCLRKPDQLRRSPVAPSAIMRQSQPATLAPTGRTPGVTARGLYLQARATISDFRCACLLNLTLAQDPSSAGRLGAQKLSQLWDDRKARAETFGGVCLPKNGHLELRSHSIFFPIRPTSRTVMIPSRENCPDRSDSQ
jgi:Integrase core domain